MNAKDIAYGYAIGFNDGVAAGGGGGGVDTPDPDFQKWLDLPEPNDNQAVFLIRTTAANQVVSMTVNLITSPIVYEDSFSIDWGDGSSIEMFASSPASAVSHTYSIIGEYIVTFTNILGYNDFAKPKSLIMAKYGDGMCVHLIKSTEGTKTNNFSSWNNLRYIRLPSSTEFNDGFFSACNALRKIEFEGNIQLYSKMFMQCYNLDFSNINFENITQIPDQCFVDCLSLKNLPFPSCTSIGYSSFGRCINLKSVSLPACTSIGNSTFASCYNLKDVLLPSCTSIGNNTFANCFELTNFKASSKCVYGKDCFKGCYKSGMI